MGREIKRVPVDFNWPIDTVWGGFLPPDDAELDADGDYVSWEATEPPTGDGWQVWETVSEGSPITSVFPTAAALVDHLATVGTSWDKGQPWRRDAAASFVARGYAPSMVMAGGSLFDGAKDADLIDRALR